MSSTSPPETVDGHKVLAVVQDKPEPILLLENGTFATESSGSWQTRTSLKSAQKLASGGKRKNLKALRLDVSNAEKIEHGDEIVICGKRKTCLLRDSYGRPEQVRSYQKCLLHDPDLVDDWNAAVEKNEKLIAPILHKLDAAKRKRDAELETIAGKFVRITVENVDELMAQAAKEEE